LWSSISVTTRNNSDVERQLEDVGAWLGRSGLQPLAISLCLGGVGWGIDPDAEVDLDPILDLFISFIGRWENVHLELVGPLRGSIWSIHLLRAPLLRRFKVVFEYGADQVLEPLFSMLSDSPNLTDIASYDNCDAAIHIDASAPPWSHLTRFETNHHLEVMECFHVLRLCPNLIDCAFHRVALFELPSPIPDDMSIVHRHLRVLTLRVQYNDSDSFEFFDHLTLPALSAFVIIFAGHDWPQASFKAFLSRSGCSLKTIELHTAALSTHDIVELLSLLPTLKELLIRGSEVDPLGDTLFLHLIYDETAQESCLCPELEVITLYGYIAPSNGMLAKMLESRYRSDTSQARITRLRKFTVRLNPHRHGYKQQKKYWKELETVRKRGLDVVMDRYPT
jgi:hypothetical protein